MKKQKTIIMVLFVSMSFCSASAQDITATERREIIDNLVGQLANQYVDLNLGRKRQRPSSKKRRNKRTTLLRQRLR